MTPSDTPPLPARDDPSEISVAPRDLALRLSLACSHFARLAGRRAEVGASSVGWRVASTLERRGPMRVSEVATYERVSRPTATAVIQRLEERGLVSRRPDPQDSRSVLIELTDRGREQLTAWRASLADGVGELLADLPEHERATLADATRILTAILDTADEKSPTA